MTKRQRNAPPTTQTMPTHQVAAMAQAKAEKAGVSPIEGEEVYTITKLEELCLIPDSVQTKAVMMFRTVIARMFMTRVAAVRFNMTRNSVEVVDAQDVLLPDPAEVFAGEPIVDEL